MPGVSNLERALSRCPPVMAEVEKGFAIERGTESPRRSEELAETKMA